MPVDARQTTHVLRRMLDEPRAPGCMWRYLPSNFPPWQTVFDRFRRFRLTSWWRMLSGASRRMRVGRHPAPSGGILDSQSVKTIEKSAGIMG